MLFSLELILNNASQSVEHGKARSIGIEVPSSIASLGREPDDPAGWQSDFASRSLGAELVL